MPAPDRSDSLDLHEVQDAMREVWDCAKLTGSMGQCIFTVVTLKLAFWRQGRETDIIAL
jgi:hypothetical protein